MIARLSPGGTCIASGTEAGVMYVCRLVSMAEEWSIQAAHTGAIRVIAWSPDGAAIASGGDDAIVNVWEAATGTLVALYTEHTGPIVALDWSPDGCWITSVARTGSPHIWQLHHDPNR